MTDEAIAVAKETNDANALCTRLHGLALIRMQRGEYNLGMFGVSTRE